MFDTIGNRIAELAQFGTDGADPARRDTPIAAADHAAIESEDTIAIELIADESDVALDVVPRDAIPVIRTVEQGKPRVDLKLGGAKIFIAPVAAGSNVNPPPTTPYQGLDHFGLAVSGIDAIAAELKAKGAEFTMEPTTVRPGVRVCFIRGPQGVSIELLDRNIA